ncbi:MAG: hypothetical protein A4E53_01495 [Pelotomaculum sp. PtaB.Bin104]|nr:MAG: hypothetical protein A4E53_01495 [Pelotomaculum sp. PtaB.Bin104]
MDRHRVGQFQVSKLSVGVFYNITVEGNLNGATVNVLNYPDVTVINLLVVIILGLNYLVPNPEYAIRKPEFFCSGVNCLLYHPVKFLCSYGGFLHWCKHLQVCNIVSQFLDMINYAFCYIFRVFPFNKYKIIFIIIDHQR